MTEFDKKKNRIDYTWKFEDLFGVDHKIGDKITSGYTVYSKSYLHENIDTDIHSHEFYEMNIVLGGVGTHIIEGASFHVRAGDVFVIPPLTVHSYVDTQELEVYHVLINKKFIVENSKEAYSMKGFMLSQTFSNSPRSLFLRKFSLSATFFTM